MEDKNICPKINVLINVLLGIMQIMYNMLVCYVIQHALLAVEVHLLVVIVVQNTDICLIIHVRKHVQLVIIELKIKMIKQIIVVNVIQLVMLVILMHLHVFNVKIHQIRPRI